MSNEGGGCRMKKLAEDMNYVNVEYNVPFLSFLILSYVPNALWLRQTLFILSDVNCFRDNSLNPYSRGDRKIHLYMQFNIFKLMSLFL